LFQTHRLPVGQLIARQGSSQAGLAPELSDGQLG
jgi:hypothetical protein